MVFWKYLDIENTYCEPFLRKTVDGRADQLTEAARPDHNLGVQNVKLLQNSQRALRIYHGYYFTAE